MTRGGSERLPAPAIAAKRRREPPASACVIDRGGHLGEPVTVRILWLCAGPNHRVLSGLVVALVCIGCTPPAAQESQAAPGTAGATATASTTPTTPGINSSATPDTEPSSTPAEHTGFHYSDILRVEVDGLAVRTAPSVSSGLVQGYRVVGVPAIEPTGEVRLNAGDFVSVHLGPLPVGDKVWYLVYPAQDARLHYGFVAWSSAPENAGLSEPGWVAGSVGDQQYLTLHRRPETAEIEEYLPVGLTLSGTGDYNSAPQARHDLFTFNWAVALADQDASCAVSITLVPEDGAEPVVAVDTSTNSVAQGPMSGSGAALNLPWGVSAGGTWDTFTVSITSGCTWVIGLHALHHD